MHISGYPDLASWPLPFLTSSKCINDTTYKKNYKVKVAKSSNINFTSYYYHSVPIVHMKEVEISLKWKSPIQWISNNSTLINK